MKGKELRPGQIVRHKLRKDEMIVIKIFPNGEESVQCRNYDLVKMNFHPEELEVKE